jgi:hypothetical protein
MHEKFAAENPQDPPPPGGSLEYPTIALQAIKCDEKGI